MKPAIRKLLEELKLAKRRADAMQETLDAIATLVGVPVPGRDGGVLLERIRWLASLPIPNGTPLATVEDVLRMLREIKPDPNEGAVNSDEAQGAA